MIGCKALTNEEISSMSDHLSLTRDKMLFLLGTKTGFRISELLSIKIKDLLEYNGSLKPSITVFRGQMKGKLASRSIPLSKDILESLKVYIDSLNNHQTYLFMSQKGNPLSRIQAWKIIKRASRESNIMGKVATHSCRKTFAKRIYESSKRDLVATQRALGHKSVNSTISYLSFYTDNEIDKLILESQE